jgi:DNA replication and repair protein RecF
MIVHQLTLGRFRNYGSLHLSFEPGINVITGDNGQGKTNLIEAIHFALTGRSFRTQRAMELIQHGHEELYSRVEYAQQDIPHQVMITFGTKGKKVVHNATSYSTLSSITGAVPTVAIAPSDIAMIMDGPLVRRRELNVLMAQHDPCYVYHLTRYHHALKARNVLLKRRSTKTIRVYEELLSEAASYIAAAREKLCKEIAPLLTNYFHELTDTPFPIALDYPQLEQKDKGYFLAEYEKNRSYDEQTGTTSIGPHRDDIRFLISGKEAKLFASEGQKRALLTSWKLAELQLLEQKTGCPPVLFIDDFAIHLDLYRSQRLEQAIHHYPQVFLTTPHNIFKSSTLYRVDGGVAKKTS